jgi:hypothetical protein
MIMMGNLLFSIFGEDGKSCILAEYADNVVNVGATTESCPYKSGKSLPIIGDI